VAWDQHWPIVLLPKALPDHADGSSCVPMKEPRWESISASSPETAMDT